MVKSEIIEIIKELDKILEKIDNIIFEQKERENEKRISVLENANLVNDVILNLMELYEIKEENLHD